MEYNNAQKWDNAIEQAYIKFDEYEQFELNEQNDWPNVFKLINSKI